MKNKTLQRFLLSHIAIELIVLISIIPFIVFALQSEQEKQVTKSYNLLQSDIKALSAEFIAAENMSASMHRNPMVLEVINMRGELSGTQYYRASEARKTWYTMSNLQLLRNNYVFFSGNEVVFSPERIFFSWEDFYDYWMRYENVDYVGWRERLEQTMRRAQRVFDPAEQVFTYAANGQSASRSMISYNIPIANLANSAMIVCHIDTQELHTALRFDSLLPESFLCLYDANNTLLYSCNDPYAVTPQTEEITELLIDSSRYQIFTVRDEASGLCYVIGTPAAFFTHSFVSSFGVLFVYTILALLVASALSIFLSYRQYSPIKEVYAFFKQHSDVPVSDTGDEYRYFLHSYKELLHSNQSIRKTIVDYDAALTTRAMEDLLCGHYRNEQEMKKLCDRVTLPQAWRVCNAVLEPQNLEAGKDVMGVISVKLMEMLEKCWKEELLIHPLSEKRLLSVIPTQEDGSAVSIAEKLSHLVHNIRSETGVEVFFAVSDMYQQPEKLTQAYEESKSILGCRHACEGNVLFSEDVEKPDEIPLLTTAASGKLREYVLAGDATRCAEFIRSYLQNRYLHEHDYSQLFFGIRGIFIQLTADTPPGEMSDLPFYITNRPRDEQTNELVEAGTALCARFSDRKKSHNEDLKNRLLAYLEEHYTDPEIYGKSVASAFSISEKYLYSFFKEQTGINFASYLENLRLTQATQLLDNSKFTVNEIAKMVGFNSPNTFYKAFRRVYGTPPSAYRDLPKAR